MRPSIIANSSMCFRGGWLERSFGFKQLGAGHDCQTPKLCGLSQTPKPPFLIFKEG